MSFNPTNRASSTIVTTSAPGRWYRAGLFGLKGEKLGTLVSVTAVLLLWLIGGSYIPSYIFPTIPEAVARLVELLSTYNTYVALTQTLVRILGGFAVSAVIGIALGVLIAMSPVAQALLRPLVRLIMGVPALTWVLLGIIWFKSMEMRVWFFMFIIVFPITVLNTYDGVRSISAELYQMMRSLRPSVLTMARLLIVPAAMPFIFSGLRISLSFAGRIAVFGEALAASSGIGAEMMLANQMFDTTLLLVWTVILIGVLSILDAGLELAERRAFRWRREFNG